MDLLRHLGSAQLLLARAHDALATADEMLLRTSELHPPLRQLINNLAGQSAQQLHDWRHASRALGVPTNGMWQLWNEICATNGAPPRAATKRSNESERYAVSSSPIRSV